MAFLGMSMNGLTGGLGGMIPPPPMAAPPAPRRGFFSRLGQSLESGDFMSRLMMARALADGDYGTAAQMQFQMQRLQAAQGEAEAERQTAASLMGNAADLTNPDGSPMFSKAQIGAMRPQELSNAVQDRLQVRQFAAGGGSLLDPTTGRTTMAPSRHEYQGTVFDVPGGGGDPVLRRRGIQAVPLQPGGEVALVDTWAGQEASAPQSPQPQGNTNEAALRAQAAEAIRRGADPAQVAQRLQQLLRGGPR